MEAVAILFDFPVVPSLFVARNGVQNFIFLAALTEGAAERLIILKLRQGFCEIHIFILQRYSSFAPLRGSLALVLTLFPIPQLHKI